MVLAEIAMYIFLVTALIVLSYKAVWIAYLLLGFRFVQIIIEGLFPNFTSGWSPWVEIVFYAVLGIVFASSVYFATVPFTLARYIILVIIAVVVLTQYSIKEILFFADFYEEIKVFNLSWLSGQLKELFEIDSEGAFDFLKKFGESMKEFLGSIFNPKK